MSSQDLADALDRVAKGDKAAFEAVYAATYLKLYGVVVRILRRSDLAEEVLQRHTAVSEVAVVGRRHADWGEEVVACVVSRGDVSEAALERELDALCIAHIARFKRPKAYVFLDELPKNNTGKVEKNALRKTVAAR